MKAYRLVYEWVRTGAVPDTTPADQPQIPGACLVIRAQGGILGRGTSFATDNAALRQATGQALDEARRRLQFPNDALADERVRAAAQEWTLSLELAGPLIPITPATFADCDLELQNGLDGLAARVDGANGNLAANFPGLMLSLGISPADGLASAISTAADEPNLAIKVDPRGQPPHIAERRNATYYRFRTTHLAQLDPRSEPIFLYRGGSLTDSRDITAEFLRTFADNLAQRLAGRTLPDGSVTAPLDEPYFSWKGRSVPSMDPVLDSTLRHLGLLSYAALPPRADEPAPSQSLRAGIVPNAAAFVKAQRDGDAGEKPAELSPIHAAGFAALAHAAALSPGADADSLWRLLGNWPEWERSLAACYSVDDGWAAEIGEPLRAFIAYGLACRATESGGAADTATLRRDQASGAIRSIYRETRQGLLVGHMPWLGWAEVMLAKGSEKIPASAALRDMRDMVWKHQLSPDDVRTDAPDLAGGVVFTSGGNPLPTWQTVRPAAFLATMMSDPRLSDGPEQLREVSRITAALRFLRQLAVDEAAAYAAPDPQTAKWGIRASVWDQRQTPEATALTLITTCEALHSLQTIAADPPDKAP